MAASGVAENAVVESTLSTRHHQIEKWYYDYAENIEAVNIHFACSPLGEVPDWNSQRATRFLPLVEPRLRRKTLKLPTRILDMSSGQLTDRYLLHHYFQIFADGDTLYSSLYTEEVCTGAGTIPAPRDDTSIPMLERFSEVTEKPGSAESALIHEIQAPPPASKKKRIRKR
jgi:hypothetical protein